MRGGCKNTATKTIVVNQLRPIAANATDTIVCKGVPVTLSAICDTTNFVWSGAVIDGLAFVPATTATYTVSVTDQNNCTNSASVNITVKQLPAVIAHTTDSTVCKGASTTLYATGASTYTWSGGAVNGVAFSPDSSNTYIVTGTGTNGCTKTAHQNVFVKQPVSTFNIHNETYFGACNGAIQANLTGGYGAISAQWLNSSLVVLSIGDSVSSLCPGTYTLNLIDSNSCTNAYTRTILAGLIPPTPPICLVSVDTTFTHNVVIWEKTNLNMTGIDSFIVYREITTNNYIRLGGVHKDSLSIFEDFSANPSTTGYRYKIKAKDIYGIESLYSEYHNTIFLNYYGTGILGWTQYQVENNTTPVSSYEVYRDDNSTGNFQLIGNTTGSQSGYTDVDYATYSNSRYFVLAIRGAGACSPTRATINTTRSNIKGQSVSVGIQTNGASFPEITIYPNPTNESITIELNQQTGTTSIKILNILGQLMGDEIALPSSTGKTLKQINVSDYARGVYTVCIENNGNKAFKKLIVN